MMKEFYCVWTEDGEAYFFKNKDNAYKFLWQTYLDNTSGYETDEDIEKAEWELYELSMITGVGELCVTGFED